MNPNAPYNSGAFHFTQKAKVYCAKIIPLVFDNTLSYYESLCGFVAKVNEMVDALNAQNMNIIEFTHMVELEMQKFEKYMEQRQQDFETHINEEWEAEKLVNHQFREQLTSEWNSFRNEIDLRIQTFMAAFREEWLEWKTDTMNDLNTFKANLEEQQDDFEEHILSLQTSFEQREQAARVAFQNNLNSRLQQWETDTLTLFQTSIENWEDDTKDDLEAEFRLFITQEIGGQVASLSTQINMVAQSVSREATARQEGDQALQNQINQLTPTGSIKADTPDQDGNSQLYTVDDSTTPPTRTNIFPKVNPQGEDDRKYFTPDQDEMKLAADWNIITQTNDRGFVIANNQQINGQTALTTLSMFAIKKSLIQGAGNNAVHDLGLLDIQVFPIMKNYGNIPEDVNILIMNDSTRTDYNVRYADISGITYLIIPIIIVNRSTNDILQNNLQLYCSFSQYLGGMSVVGAGGGITVDDQLSTTSTNPVENRVITNNFDNYVPYTTYTQEMATKASVSGLSALTQVVNGKASQTDLAALDAAALKQTDLTSTVANGNPNPVTSGGVFNALNGFTPTIQDATTLQKGVVQIGDNINVLNGLISVPKASLQQYGVILPGNNLSVNNGVISVPEATANSFGVVKLTDNLSVLETNAIKANAVATALQGKAGVQLEYEAVKADTPDSQNVSQMYYTDVNNVRHNVYPALAPAGVLNWLVPKIPSEASINDDIFISFNRYDLMPSIASYYSIKGNIIYNSSNSNYQYFLWINMLKYGITTINDALNLFTIVSIANNSESGIPVNSNNGISTQVAGYAVLQLQLPGGNLPLNGVKILYG